MFAAEPDWKQPIEPPRKTVLIVDDTQDIADLLAVLFRLRGCEAVLAGDGRQAIDEAARYAPDLILMDICMPTMDGYQATRRIHDIPYLARVPVVAMSAYCDTDWAELAKNAGCEECISKPLEPETIDAIIHRYLYDC